MTELKPWANEPDREEFKHLGFDCLLQRNHVGAWCGYVGVTKKHPAFEKHYDDRLLHDIDVHGGLTYADECQGHICHVVADGEDDHVWWFGFDCNHCFDYAPHDKIKNDDLRKSMFNLDKMYTESGIASRIYRDINYVRDQVKFLAEQLATIG